MIYKAIDVILNLLLLAALGVLLGFVIGHWITA